MPRIKTADWHLGSQLEGWTTPDGRDGRTSEILAAVDGMITKAALIKATRLDVLGDVFNGKRPSPAMFEALISRLNRLEDLGIETRLLLGNHSHSNSGRNALAPIKEIGYEHVRVVDSPTSEVVGEDNYIYVPHLGKADLGLEPGEATDKPFQEALVKTVKEMLRKGMRNVVLGHMNFAGAVSGSEEIMLEGGVNPFPAVDSSLVHRVWVGHIHKFQIIKWNRVQVVYPGSPARFDLGEREDHKGYVVYDEKADDWTFEELDAVPYKLINVDLVSKKSFDAPEDKIKKAASGCIVKIRVKVSEQNRRGADFNGIREAFARHAAHVSGMEVETVREDKEEKKLSRFDPIGAAEAHIMEKYGDDGERLAALAREVLGEAAQ